MATLLRQSTATFSQDENQVSFTSGSSVSINRSAQDVFSSVLDTKTYEHWNTTNPRVNFLSNSSERVFQSPDTHANLSFFITPTSKPFDVPIRILAVRQDDIAEVYRLDWRGQMLPSWFGLAERVQTVCPRGPDKCDLIQWESMSGWGVQILDWVLGIRKKMDEANLKYAEDLKRFMERAD